MFQLSVKIPHSVLLQEAQLTSRFPFFCIMEPIGKSLIPVFPLLLYEKTNDAIESASIMPFNVNSKK